MLSSYSSFIQGLRPSSIPASRYILKSILKGKISNLPLSGAKLYWAEVPRSNKQLTSFRNGSEPRRRKSAKIYFYDCSSLRFLYCTLQ